MKYLRYENNFRENFIDKQKQQQFKSLNDYEMFQFAMVLNVC